MTVSAVRLGEEDGAGARPDRGRRLRRALRVGGLLVAAAGCVALARHVDFGGALAALAAASPWPVALALLVNLGPRTAARARRTLVLLRTAPEGRIGARDLVPVVLASYAAGTLVPGPAEELLMGASLTRFGFRPRALLAIHLVDKSIGVLSVGLLAAPLLPGAARAPGLLAALAALALGATGAWLSRARRAIRFRVVLEALACLVVSNLASIAMVAFSLAAVGAPVSFNVALEIFALASCACILPLAPGNVGVLEAAFAVVATHRGVPPSAALAAAVIYHGAQIVPLVAAGVVPLIQISLANGRPARPAPEPEACALPS